ncbi:MAG TPA: hypothetical protein PKC44_08850 [Agitococcus sp.]|nr:hypothetical protein [Agitococcus sp.]
MIPIKKYSDRYLGWSQADLQNYDYGKYWQPLLKPLSVEAQQALLQGALPEILLPDLAHAPQALFGYPDYPLENGYCLCADGATHIAIRTDMPNVSPKMIDWWFAWHNGGAERYKLWHPQAHVHAQWLGSVNTKLRGRALYIGQTSCVDEYVGGQLGRYAIHFLDPKQLGFNHPSLADDQQATAICARIGFADYPINIGYLVHHVRQTATGAEMRSRFWLGGRYAQARQDNRFTQLLVTGAKQLLKPSEKDAKDLLVHCAQEMAHLASFLPNLYADYQQLD